MDIKYTATATMVINAPASKVWEALTNPELIKQYLFGSVIVTDWKEGSPILYKGNYQGKPFEDKGSVVTVDVNKLLVLTHWSPLSGTMDAPENYHTVSYTLISENNETKLTITQDNNASVKEQKQSEQFWTTVLEGINKVVGH